MAKAITIYLCEFQLAIGRMVDGTSRNQYNSKHFAKKGVDLIDVSSGGGGVSHQQIPLGPNYQVPFAERIKKKNR
jgi:2,4-dienoyl-CoA reductase-like NADH-dependent reductase (Old Yellow Enzyme family)